ncbi:MAG TPA: glycerophosphodiester phosphodiesterase family protein [Chloroflexia bacterium]|nr:glycerophosphodiester phosphodiesterase family protein [Chloroflexia bacterium]
MLRSKTGRLAITGHRGAAGYAPENTMPAFLKAHELKTDIIEFDVHLSRDGRCVILHDEMLDRTTDGHGLVWEHSWEELKKLDAGSWFDLRNRDRRKAQAENPLPAGYIPLPIVEESFAGTPLPLLEEVLEWSTAVRMPVSIEIKAPWPFYHGLTVYPDIVEKVLELVARYGDEELTSLHSFDHRMVLRCKELNPNITTMVSLYGAIYVDPLAPIRAARAEGFAIGSNWVTPELVELAHAEDKVIFGWGLGEDPFNQAEMLRKLVDMGVDFVSSGVPDLLRQVVENS